MRETGHASLQSDDRMTVGCDDKTKSKSGKVAASIADNTCATKPHLALNFQSSQRVARGVLAWVRNTLFPFSAKVKNVRPWNSKTKNDRESDRPGSSDKNDYTCGQIASPCKHKALTKQHTSLVSQRPCICKAKISRLKSNRAVPLQNYSEQPVRFESIDFASHGRNSPTAVD